MLRAAPPLFPTTTGDQSTNAREIVDLMIIVLRTFVSVGGMIPTGNLNATRPPIHSQGTLRQWLRQT
jgi:hypothetical protein